MSAAVEAFVNAAFANDSFTVRSMLESSPQLLNSKVSVNCSFQTYTKFAVAYQIKHHICCIFSTLKVEEQL